MRTLNNRLRVLVVSSLKPDMWLVILQLLLAVTSLAAEYGVDVSYPMHHAAVSTNYAWLPHNVDPDNNPAPDFLKEMPIQPLGDMQKKHHDYINGCVEHYNKQKNRGKICLQNEADRIEMSLRQPQSMRNYTELGYTKIRAPEHVFQLLKEFWEENKSAEKQEKWHVGNIYTYVLCFCRLLRV